MPTVFVTRRAHFNAAHRLHNPDRSEDWNRETFGKCNLPNWHGHNYVLEVTVAGPPDADTGFVVDLAWLRDLIAREIEDEVDHRNLNLDVPWLAGVLPSTENLCIAFWGRLAPHVPAPARVHRIRLFETERNFADYYGD